MLISIVDPTDKIRYIRNGFFSCGYLMSLPPVAASPEMVRELLAHIPATIKSEPPILSGGRPFLPDLGAEADLTPLHLAAHEGNEGVVRILLNIPGVQADGTSRLNVRLATVHVTPCFLPHMFVFAFEC